MLAALGVNRRILTLRGSIWPVLHPTFMQDPFSPFHKGNRRVISLDPVPDITKPRVHKKLE